MKRTFLGRVKDEGEELVEIVTPMSISRALNNHGLALRQRAMLMTEEEFGGGRSREGSERSGTTTTASTAMAMAAVVVAEMGADELQPPAPDEVRLHMVGMQAKWTPGPALH